MEALREAMGREMLKAFTLLPDWMAERSRLVSEHASIASAIADGDGDAAADAVAAHIRGFYARLLEPPPPSVARSEASTVELASAAVKVRRKRPTP